MILSQEERNLPKRETESSSDSKSEKAKEKRSILSFLQGKGKKKWLKIQLKWLNYLFNVK